MNGNFNTLVTFLENAAAKPEVALAFMTGNTNPFDTAVQPDDLIFSKLLEKSDQIYETVLPLLFKNLFTAIKQLLTLMIPMRRFCCIHTRKPLNGCHIFHQMKKTNLCRIQLKKEEIFEISSRSAYTLFMRKGEKPSKRNKRNWRELREKA